MFYKQLNLFIYQARESSLVQVSDTSVSAENVIYEAFVMMGLVSVVSLHCFHGETEMWRQVCSSSFQASLNIPFPPENQ